MKKTHHTDNTEKLLAELEKMHTFLEAPYPREKTDIWESLQDKMGAEEKKVAVPLFRKYRWLAAASLALLMAVSLLLRFYAHTVSTKAGEMITVTLPDGSNAVLSPHTRLTYYPLWWRLSAKIKLSGEAFFYGHHNRRFSVQSDLGTVTVLGTSFDVYAHHNQYRVVCFTGKVRVTSRTKNRLILSSGEKAEITPDGEITFSKNMMDNRIRTNGQLVFTAVPLVKVLNEMADYYQVKIILKKKITAAYTGNFPANIPVEQALQIVCKPFGLTFVKTDQRIFVVQ